MTTERSLSNPHLTGTILPMLLRLPVPNVLSMTLAALLGVAENYYIGVTGARDWLGGMACILIRPDGHFFALISITMIIFGISVALALRFHIMESGLSHLTPVTIVGRIPQPVHRYERKIF